MASAANRKFIGGATINKKSAARPAQGSSLECKATMDLLH